ncbi:MAG: GIY-YIG nuclease family protein [Gammaproteobacteria bacterium]|nr:GIY-YIG nuclease family protein [Gammaproteobacteria bacterium]
MTRPQTLQIFLPSGDPQGIRVAEITARIVRVIEVPRSLLAEFLRMPEANQVGVYFLVGPRDESDETALYIGQSGAVGPRLAQHNQEKDFWNRALVVVSLTNNLTQTHALFLEWLGIRDAKAAGRFAMENGNGGARPHTPAPLEADCHEIHETVGILLATLGYPVFKAVGKSATAEQAETFFCRRNGAEGRGLYTSEGFVLLAGSSGPCESKSNGIARIRERLGQDGVLEVAQDRIVVTKDHAFGSPSGAAAALLGRNANGWVEWKNAAGQTLHEVKRGNGHDKS